jgi:uncharacterized protein YjbI with pentapeptide repeats
MIEQGSTSGANRLFVQCPPIGKLRRTPCAQVIMTQADFSRVDMSGAVLAGASGMESANLGGAVLRDVDLGGFWLPSAQVP